MKKCVKLYLINDILGTLVGEDPTYRKKRSLYDHRRKNPLKTFFARLYKNLQCLSPRLKRKFERKPLRQTYEGKKKRDYDPYKEDFRSAHLIILKFLAYLEVDISRNF